ncbi:MULTISPECIES: ABC transporter permease [Halomicrobium]|uniref:Binding-protein-dependent transport systems inner membrane component n=2 Tax=Halomicrobium mukohataei TaxID=57705 RepID=C7P4M5_HALMD|nr:MULTISPECIES: iron ABC transporter permease [Halomicrobium]ACV48047.1 binding-protein-dependent transport systems inner membrane component [Halomicrobium mukohataei DSM 12286]QCD66479.1 iron ABC transporter permease [Halomicrobium mukohataei]QFR21285.1 ABC transporter permease subunit [Halomicrobium sp. ZPS1]
MDARVDRLALPVGTVATLATLLVVFYYPVGSVLVGAVRVGGQLSLAPLKAVLGDPFYADLFGFTAYQALLSTVASVLVGLPGAYLLARFEFPGRRFLRSVTILPFVLPSIMVAVGFLAMFGRTGLFNDLLAVVGLGPVELTFTLEIIVLAHAFYNAPLVTRLVTAAWESVDARRVETARTLGASPLVAFRDVVAPQLLPALLTAAVLTFLFTFMSFPIVLALGGLEFATVEVWLFARVRDLALTEAATLGAIETALSLGLIYVYLRFEAMQLRAGGGSRSIDRVPLLAGWRSLTDPRRLALLCYGGVVLVLFVGPLASLVVESVTTPEGQLTTDYYAFLLAQQASAATGTVQPVPAITNSLLFAAGALVLALPMGVVVSVVAARETRGSRVAEALLTAPLAVSGIVLGLGMLRTLVFGTELFGHRLTVTGPVAIVAAHAVAGYPFVTRTVTPALSAIDDRLVDAARSLGASRTTALLDVELPLTAAALVAGAAFAVAISIGEFDTTVLLAEGVDSATMPVALERYTGNRSLGPNLGPATAMGTVLLAVTTVSFVVIDRVGGRWER